MSFILPVIIESRKILLLDLEKTQLDKIPQDFGEDIYIVELPDQHDWEILSIQKDKLIQSLLKVADDIKLNECFLTVSIQVQILL